MNDEMFAAARQQMVQQIVSYVRYTRAHIEKDT